MNITDAIKSGRPFKRASCSHHPDWYTGAISSSVGDASLVDACGTTYSISYEDIVADDWEMHEPEVTITRTQFENAVSLAIGKVPEDNWGNGRFVAALAKYLGLED